MSPALPGNMQWAPGVTECEWARRSGNKISSASLVSSFKIWVTTWCRNSYSGPGKGCHVVVRVGWLYSGPKASLAILRHYLGICNRT